MKLELVNEPLKVVQTIAIADLEDTIVTVGKRSRIFPVVETRSYETIGYYITGDIYLGADTIVNTQKGAIGEPIEKLAKEGFRSLSAQIEMIVIQWLEQQGIDYKESNK